MVYNRRRKAHLGERKLGDILNGLSFLFKKIIDWTGLVFDAKFLAITLNSDLKAPLEKIQILIHERADEIETINALRALREIINKKAKFVNKEAEIIANNNKLYQVKKMFF